MRMCLAQEQDAQGAGCSKETSEFVNHGLLLWNESRQKWVGHKKATTRSQLLLVLKSRRRPCMTRKLWLCCLNPGKGNHKVLKSNKPFAKPVPLGEMVEILVDVWEEEGMYEMVLSRDQPSVPKSEASFDEIVSTISKMTDLFTNKIFLL